MNLSDKELLDLIEVCMDHISTYEAYPTEVEISDGGPVLDYAAYRAVLVRQLPVALTFLDEYIEVRRP